MSVIQINGCIYDHTSLRLGFLDSTLIKDLVKSVKWSHGFDVPTQYAASPVPLPPTRGRYAAQFSMDVYLEAWDHVLKTVLKNGYLELSPSTTTLIYQNKGGKPYKVEACESRPLKSDGGSSADTNGAVIITIPFFVRYIKENDKFPFDVQE